MTESLIPSLLDQTVAGHEERTAVRDGLGAWTYGQLTQRSRVVAHRLAESGIRPGDRLLCLVPGGRAFTALLFGALRRGAVLIPVAEDSSDYRLRALIDDAKPALIITPDPPVDQEWAHLSSSTPVVPVAALINGETTSVDPPVSPDSPALMIYTSGSTAQPKGIVCSHAAVVWTARAIASALGYQSSDIIYVRLPVSFDYGLYQILLAVLAGAETIFPSEPLSRGELNAVRSSKATVLPVVPTLAGVLSQLAERDQRPTSVRLITNTGAALVGQDAERLRSAFPGASLICMYGMSECKRITIAEPDEDLTFPATVGRALPGTKLYIVDDNGDLLPPGEVGEIISAGPHVMSGYWNEPVAQAERFTHAPGGADRALRTGDYGYVDDAGRLYFVGRRDDIFKRRGWRTSCTEIESAMLDVPGVRQAACVAPGSDGVLTVWAVAERAPSDILREIGNRLGSAKVPDRCLVVDQLPQTRNGKIDKVALHRSIETASGPR